MTAMVAVAPPTAEAQLVGVESAAPAEEPADADGDAQLEEAQRRLDAADAELVALRQRVEGADSRIGAIREQLAANADVAGVRDRDLAGLELSALESLLLEQQELLAGERKQLVELDARLSSLIQTATGGAPALAASEGAATTAPPAIDSGAAATAQQGDSAVSLQRRAAEIEGEVTRYRLTHSQLLTSLITAERDLVLRAISQREPFITRLNDEIRARRDAEASRSLEVARQAQRETAFEPREVRVLADAIVSLREELNSVASRTGEVNDQLQESSRRLERIRSDFQSTRDRVDVVGSTPAVGRMLQRRLSSLPSMGGYRRAATARRAEISESIDRQIDLDEQIRELGDVEQEVDGIMFTLLADVPEDEPPELHERIRELTQQKRNTLSELHAQYGALAAGLTQLDLAQHGLVDQSREYVEFIEGELMTIPSGPPLHRTAMDDWRNAFNVLLSMDTWSQLATDILFALKLHMGLLFPLLLLFAVLLGLQRRARRRIGEIAPLTRKVRTDGIGLTVAALAWTLVLAAPWPLLGAGIAWIVHRGAPTDLVTAFAAGLLRASVLCLIFNFLRHMVRREGLALRHFRWSENTARADGEPALVHPGGGAADGAEPVPVLFRDAGPGAAQSAGRSPDRRRGAAVPVAGDHAGHRSRPR